MRLLFFFLNQVCLVFFTSSQVKISTRLCRSKNMLSNERKAEFHITENSEESGPTKSLGLKDVNWLQRDNVNPSRAEPCHLCKPTSGPHCKIKSFGCTANMVLCPGRLVVSPTARRSGLLVKVEVWESGERYRARFSCTVHCQLIAHTLKPLCTAGGMKGTWYGGQRGLWGLLLVLLLNQCAISGNPQSPLPASRVKIH